MSALPQPSTAVRWVRIPDSTAYYLAHDCIDCGDPNAPFGVGFSTKHRKPGTWRCWPCYRNHEAKTVTP